MKRKRQSTRQSPRPRKPITGRDASRVLPSGYGQLLDELKARVRAAQVKAAVAANRELIHLYWDIGRLIVERQHKERWGQAVIERLADDIQRAFPGLKGFSRSNVFRMRAFYLAYQVGGEIVALPVRQLSSAKIPRAVGQLSRQKVAQAVRQLSGPPLPDALATIPWGHNVVLMQKLADRQERLWYAEQIVAHGWSRAVLTVQIELDLYRRQGKAVTNFAKTLPAPQSDLAHQTLKDPYVFDFLTLHEDSVEQQLESNLVDHVQKFLLELGAGFAFVGRQVPLAVGDDDFYLDLLFYHLKLRCFVVIDLKTRKFTPDDAGKMNFYLSAVDDKLRHSDDQPSIGLVLCKRRDRIIAEYALRDMSKPIGVAEWQTRLVQSLPKRLQNALPSVEEIEAELANVEKPTVPRPRKSSKRRAKE